MPFKDAADWWIVPLPVDCRLHWTALSWCCCYRMQHWLRCGRARPFAAAAFPLCCHDFFPDTCCRCCLLIINACRLANLKNGLARRLSPPSCQPPCYPSAMPIAAVLYFYDNTVPGLQQRDVDCCCCFLSSMLCFVVLRGYSTRPTEFFWDFLKWMVLPKPATMELVLVRLLYVNFEMSASTVRYCSTSSIYIKNYGSVPRVCQVPNCQLAW